ncbi:MAG: hypothetical protein KatS3mg088_107 [Patescibacteria group bacterium]|nr:MAG: hypothetical protein KatS3mg088_107 [Patescibacteria group bacterium]
MENPVPSKEIPKPIQEKILFSWKAPLRPFEKKSKEFYLNASAVLAVVSLVIFIAEGWVPVILLIAFAFLYFILHSVEPEIVDYQITNFGIKIKDKLISWNDIANFWVEEKNNICKLVIGTVFLPGKMEIVIDKKDKEKIKSIIKDYVLEQTSPPSTLEKFVDWLSSKIENK